MSALPEANRSAASLGTSSDSNACLDHRQPGLGENLKATCPEGIDIYFELVGGPVFDAVLPLLNTFARIPLCGLIAHYNAAELPPGPDHLPLLMGAIVVKRLTFRGFLYFDYASQFPDFFTDMQAWLAEGRIKYREDITDGLENAPRELIRLLKGENFGKMIIRVSPDPTATKRYITGESDELPVRKRSVGPMAE